MGMTLAERKKLYEEKHGYSVPYTIWVQVEGKEWKPWGGRTTERFGISKTGEELTAETFCKEASEQNGVNYTKAVILPSDKNPNEIKESVETEEPVLQPEPKKQVEPETGIVEGIASNLSALIQDEWQAIDGYQSAISMLETLTDSDEIIAILKEILADEYNHVGALEKALTLIAPISTKIDGGKEEAEDEIKSVK